MEREVWIRAGMFATIVVLMALILVTPNLMGHPSELASLPVLIVTMTRDDAFFIVDVTAAVQAYLYGNVTLEVSHIAPDHTNVTLATYARNDTYNAALYVPANETPLWIHTKLVDRQDNYFEYNVTVYSFNDTNNAYRLTMAFAFSDDAGEPVRTVVPPGEFRWPIPRRGTIA